MAQRKKESLEKPKDIGWDHCTRVDNRRHVTQCNYCGKILHGGITRLKRHLSGRKGECEPCSQCPREVQVLMGKHLQEGRDKKAKRLAETLQMNDTLCLEYGSNLDSEGGDGEDLDIMEQRGSSQQESQEVRRRLEERERGCIGGAGVSIVAGEDATVNDLVVAVYKEPTVGSRRQTQFFQAGSLSAPPKPKSKYQFRGPMDVELPELSRRSTNKGPMDTYSSRGQTTKQAALKQQKENEQSKRVAKAVARFFYYSLIPPSAANSPYFQLLLDALADGGVGSKGPTAKDIGGQLFHDELDDMRKFVSSFREDWLRWGSTVMYGGWAGTAKESLINCLVHSNRGTIFLKSIDVNEKVKDARFLFKLINDVIMEIGEQNVVHIVTNNDACYKTIGKLLMEHRPTMFWSPCIAHCIDLAIKDICRRREPSEIIEKARKITSFIYNDESLLAMMKSFTGEMEILRPGITRFATDIVQLESLARFQLDLRTMSASKEWLSYHLRLPEEARAKGKTVEQLVFDDFFWKKVDNLCDLLSPLVNVLKLVADDKRSVGFVYDAMNTAKMAIKAKFPRKYQRYWDIIDDRWVHQIEHSLYLAGWYLNPTKFYKNSCQQTAERTKIGLRDAIVRLIPDIETQLHALEETKLYEEKLDSFGMATAQAAVDKYHPADWWEYFGTAAPNLRQVAKRILSQTCICSGCECNWHAFAPVHAKARNKFSANKFNDLMYVHYNMRLRERTAKRKTNIEEYWSPISVDYVYLEDDPLEPWLAEDEDFKVDRQGGSWLEGSDGVEKGLCAKQIVPKGLAQASSSGSLGDCGDMSDSNVENSETISASTTHREDYMTDDHFMGGQILEIDRKQDPEHCQSKHPVGTATHEIQGLWVRGK